MKKLITSFILISSFWFLVSPVKADDEVRSLVVDLKAKGFTQTEWQDNLDSRNIIFAPNDQFQVQLIINNLGNRNQTQIVVKEALPFDVTADVPAVFTISQIPAGESYIKNITVTVKDKSAVEKALTTNSLRFTAKSEIGTEGSDYASFFTSNGVKGATTSTASASAINLPASGADTLVIGSLFAGALAFIATRLRKLARGY
jgi:hypothetical protein